MKSDVVMEIKSLGISFVFKFFKHMKGCDEQKGSFKGDQDSRYNFELRNG